MPDRRLRRRAALLLALVGGLLLLAALPATSFAASGGQVAVETVAIADAPGTQGEDCVEDPNAQPGVGLKKCETPFSIATLVPFVAGGLVILLAIAAGWYLMMRRRASRPFLPDGAEAGAAAGGGSGTVSGDWWTCRNCGSTNMNGVARCYKCGAWPR